MIPRKLDNTINAVGMITMAASVLYYAIHFAVAYLT